MRKEGEPSDSKPNRVRRKKKWTCIRMGRGGLRHLREAKKRRRLGSNQKKGKTSFMARERWENRMRTEDLSRGMLYGQVGNR